MKFSVSTVALLAAFLGQSALALPQGTPMDPGQVCRDQNELTDELEYDELEEKLEDGETVLAHGNGCESGATQACSNTATFSWSKYVLRI